MKNSLLLAVLFFSAIGNAGTERADLGCEAEGLRFHDRTVVVGRATEDRADIGRGGTMVSPKLSNLCDIALQRCVNQFFDRRHGIHECRVVKAFMVYRQNEKTFSEFVGRRLMPPRRF